MHIFDAVAVSVFGTLIVFFILISLNLMINVQTKLISFYESFILRKQKPSVVKSAEKSIAIEKPSVTQPVQNNVYGLPKQEGVKGYHFTIGKKDYYVGIEKIEE